MRGGLNPGRLLGTPADGETGSQPPLSRDTVFSVLSNHRRRLVLHHLNQQDGEASVRELSRQIALWENDVSEGEVTYKQRKRVYTSLHQTHLPKLAEAGIVAYDRNRGVVALTERATELEVYLEVVREGEIPWSVYYLGLAVVSATLVTCAWLDLPIFSLVPDIVYAAVVVVLLFGSATVHTAYSRGMSLGAPSAAVSPDVADEE